MSKQDAVPFKMRGMMQVMTQNGPMVIDKMVVDVRARPAAHLPCSAAPRLASRWLRFVARAPRPALPTVPPRSPVR